MVCLSFTKPWMEADQRALLNSATKLHDAHLGDGESHVESIRNHTVGGQSEPFRSPQKSVK